VTAGASVQFSVTATGRPAPTYQWYLNGTAISGATGSSYSNASVQSTSAGDYTVVVANNAGSVTSDRATLTVNAATSPPPSAGGGGGGGGGGAMPAWFAVALALLGVARWRVGRGAIVAGRGRHRICAQTRAGTRNGAPTLAMRPLSWSADSWPVAGDDAPAP
jgi:hypothetical protein